MANILPNFFFYLWELKNRGSSSSRSKFKTIKYTYYTTDSTADERENMGSKLSPPALTFPNDWLDWGGNRVGSASLGQPPPDWWLRCLSRVSSRLVSSRLVSSRLALHVRFVPGPARCVQGRESDFTPWQLTWRGSQAGVKLGKQGRSRRRTTPPLPPLDTATL